MAKRCTKCEEEFTDDKALCPNCGLGLVEVAAKNHQSGSGWAGTTGAERREFAIEVAGVLSKNPRFYLVMVPAVVIFGAIAVFSFLTLIIGGSVREFKKDLETNATSRLAEIDQRMSNQVDKAWSALSSNILMQFQEPRIQAVLREVASNQAASLLSNAIRPAVEESLARMDKMIRQFDSNVQARTTSLAQTNLVLRAEAKELTDQLLAFRQNVAPLTGDEVNAFNIEFKEHGYIERVDIRLTLDGQPSAMAKREMKEIHNELQKAFSKYLTNINVQLGPEYEPTRHLMLVSKRPLQSDEMYWELNKLFSRLYIFRSWKTNDALASNELIIVVREIPPHQW